MLREVEVEVGRGKTVRAGLLSRVIRVAAASRGVPVARMPAGRGIAMLADIPFGHAP